MEIGEIYSRSKFDQSNFLTNLRNYVVTGTLVLGLASVSSPSFGLDKKDSSDNSPKTPMARELQKRVYESLPPTQETSKDLMNFIRKHKYLLDACRNPDSRQFSNSLYQGNNFRDVCKALEEIDILVNGRQRKSSNYLNQGPRNFEEGFELRPDPRIKELSQDDLSSTLDQENSIKTSFNFYVREPSF